MRISIILVVLVFMVGGCSSFEKDYQQAPMASGVVEGAWVGTWTSQQGHGSGELRALVRKASEQIYIVRFKANYWGFMTSEEEIELKASSDNPLRAGGSKDLGWLAGGTYQYDATLTPRQFTATYRSVNDKGVFDLYRPQGR